MKCALFSLLAFCVFQTAFTWGAQDVDNLTTQVLMRMRAIHDRVYHTTTDEFEAQLRRGVYHSRHQCLNIDEFKRFKSRFNFLYDQCDLCFERAAENLNPEFAQQCCKEEMAEIEELAISTTASIEANLARLVRGAGASGATGASSSAQAVHRHEPPSGPSK